MNDRPTIGEIGRTLSALNPDGSVEFGGVSFRARADGGTTIEPGRTVVVTGFDPHFLVVREATAEEESAAPRQFATPALEEIPPPPTQTSAEVASREFEAQLRQLTPHVPCTLTIVALNVLVYGIMVASGVNPLNPDAPTLLSWGADYAPRTMSGEWWRIVTSTFLHFGIVHLAVNMFCLASDGPLVERLVGNVGFLVLYLLSGIGGSLASLGWSALVVSAGASGAIFGVYGALLGVCLRAGHTIPAEALAKHRGSTLTFLGYNLVYGMFAPGIDMAAHLGGLFTGFCCGVALGHPITPAAVPGRRFRDVAVALAGSCALGLAFLVVLQFRANSPDVLAELEDLQNLDQVETQVLETWNKALGQFRKGDLEPARFLELLERDVLPPWRNARQRVDQAKALASRSEQFQNIRRYMELREQAWELFCHALRDSDPGKVSESNRKMEEAEKLLRELNDSSRTSKP
jgi:membrane associated rhomboid family serine protease